MFPALGRPVDRLMSSAEMPRYVDSGIDPPGGIDREVAADLDRFRAAIDGARTADELEAVGWEIFEDLILALKGVPISWRDPEPECDSPRWKAWIACCGDAGEVVRRSKYQVTREEAARIRREYPWGPIVAMPRHNPARAGRWESDVVRLRRQAGQMLTRLALVSHMPAVPLTTDGTLFDVRERDGFTITNHSGAPACRPRHGTRDPKTAGKRLLARCSPGRTADEVRACIRRGSPKRGCSADSW
jgi:hypothetical protein